MRSVAISILCLATAALAEEVGHVTATAPALSAGRENCEIRDGVFVHGSRRTHDVALTFDACPTTHVPGFSPAIVDQLVEQSIPATFFVSGRWAEKHPQELARLAGVPFFEIALHGYRHHHLTGASTAAIRAEIEDGRQALRRLDSKPEPLFRPPFGDHPPALQTAAQAAGVTPVLWDVVPGDPNPQATAHDLERTILQHARGGSIIVQHVNGRGVATAAALPTVLSELRQRGFRFVTVSELMRECGMQTSQ